MSSCFEISSPNFSGIRLQYNSANERRDIQEDTKCNLPIRKAINGRCVLLNWSRTDAAIELKLFRRQDEHRDRNNDTEASVEPDKAEDDI